MCCLLSTYIFPMYSPTMPMAVSTQPEQSQTLAMSDAQPRTTSPMSSEQAIQTKTTKATKRKTTPRWNTMRMGFTENDVMPSTAKLSIFESGYFDSPAKRSARS